MEALEKVQSIWSHGHDCLPQRKVMEYKSKLDDLLTTLQTNNTLPPLQISLRNGICYIKRKGRVIKEADKNLGLVLMSQDFYKRLVETQLTDFQEVPAFPPPSILDKLDKIT